MDTREPAIPVEEMKVGSRYTVTYEKQLETVRISSLNVGQYLGVQNLDGKNFMWLWYKLGKEAWPTDKQPATDIANMDAKSLASPPKAAPGAFCDRAACVPPSGL